MKKQYQYQNNNIQQWGCHFLTILSFCEELVKREIPEWLVEEVYLMSVKLKYIDENCFMHNQQGVANTVLGYFNYPKKMFQIGVIENGVTTFWPWVVNAKILDWDFEVIEGRTNTGLHFYQKNYNSDDRAIITNLNKKILYKLL